MLLGAILAAVGSLIVGGLLGWLLATLRGRHATDAATRQAAAAEASVVELRVQTVTQNEKISSLQQTLDEQRAATVKAETELAEARKNIEQQKQLLSEAQDKLSDAFSALSHKALQSNNEAFLQLAGESLEKLLASMRGRLGEHQEAIKGQIAPLGEALKKYEQHVKALEESRQKAYGGLTEYLRNLATTQQRLQQETGNLVAALRAPQVRGQWGELGLERLFEIAGLTKGLHYETQVYTDGEGGGQQPDFVIRLPGARSIVIDVKTPLDAYLNAMQAETEEARTRFLKQHAAHVRQRVRDLSAKSYWDRFQPTPEFVVMFIRGESFFAAALEADTALLEEAMQKKVVLATPTTLLALLKAVAFGWRQEQMAENAQRISHAGRELHDRMRTLIDHFRTVGKNLDRSVHAYNKAVGSVESRVLPSARRIKELGAGTGEDIPPLEPIDTTARALTAEMAGPAAEPAPEGPAAQDQSDGVSSDRPPAPTGPEGAE